MFAKHNFPDLGYQHDVEVWSLLPGTVASLKVIAEISLKLQSQTFSVSTFKSGFKLLDFMNERSIQNFGDYNKTLMLWCMWDYLTASRKNYEARSHNLPLPLTNTVQKNMLKCFEPVCEGEFRIDEYIDFCRQNNWDTTCTIGEDGTRCVALPAVDIKKKQLVGLVPKLDKHGLPLPFQFPVNSNEDIKNYLAKTEEYSTNLYVIMAQSVSRNASPFCLAAFGTKNKFNFEDVCNRFNFMTRALKLKGVEVLGYSSDQDSKLFKGMKLMSELGQQPKTLHDTWNEFYFAKLKTNQIFVSDTLHYATKTKTRETKKSAPLKMGDHVISCVPYLTVLDNSKKGENLPFCK